MVETTAVPAASPVRTEHTDVNIRGVLYTGAGMIVATVLVYLAGWGTLAHFRAREWEGKRSQFPLAVQDGDHLPPKPRLEQIDRMEEIRSGAYEARPRYAEERRRLESYGWVDEEKKIVHIPIERAMKVLAEPDRLPARERKP